jgi:YidC/Oxa1 family membrane protein insertase
MLTCAYQFSSIPRTAGFSAPSCRISPLQSGRWRTGATGHSHAVLTASSVRHGSWYAPWSWGKSSTPTGDASLPGAEQVRVAEFTNNPVSHHIESAVTSATPELAPAGIDKAPVANSTSDATSTTADSMAAFNDPKTIQDLLGSEPVKDVIPKPEIDPNALIDHAGQLKELGLDYGWGITTLFERTIEHIYLNTGYGWAGSIIVASVVVRCVTFLFQALSSDRMAALAALKPLTQPIQEKMEAALARGDRQAERNYKMRYAEILRPHMGGAFSMGGLMIMQAWIGFSAFRCLRAMGELPVPGMRHDGYLWFKDLTVADPYYLIPAAIVTVFYAISKVRAPEFIFY